MAHSCQLLVLLLSVRVSTAYLVDLDAVIDRDVNSAHDGEEKWEARKSRGLNMLYSASRDEAKKSSVLDFRPSDLTHQLKLNGETFSITGKPSEYYSYNEAKARLESLRLSSARCSTRSIRTTRTKSTTAASR